jgi:hypothetical protein
VTRRVIRRIANPATSPSTPIAASSSTSDPVKGSAPVESSEA